MKKHVEIICKIGKGHECCKYLVFGVGGFECAKLTSLKQTIDKRFESGTMNAQADNCEGKIISELN